MRPTGRVLVVAVILVVGASCGGGDDPPEPQMSQRERDSVIGQSRLPGAQGVRGALEASDTAAARRRLADSLASN